MESGRRIVGAAGLMLALAAGASAKPTFVKRAQALGFKDVSSCLACHNTDSPRKGDPKHNARGKWLVAEKARRHADEVDLEWLKNYPNKG